MRIRLGFLPRVLAAQALVVVAASPARVVAQERSSAALPADYLASVLPAAARAAFPQRSAFGSLCSLGPLACALIDRPFAFNAHLELYVRPRAPDGSTSLLLPFALSVPLFGRAEVGLGSCYAGFWASEEDAKRINAEPAGRRPGGLCPLWLAGKLLLFPWLRDPHKSAALAVEYQLEHPAGPFVGVNQLGLPGALSKLSLSYRHPLGRLELGGAATVFVDHTSRAGTLQFGAHVGYRLPVGEHFWVFGQAMAQVPSWGPVLPDYANGQTLNLAPPVAGSLAAGIQQRANFGFGAGLTLLVTKSDIETRVDLLFRLLSVEIGPHIKPVIRAPEKAEEPPKVAVELQRSAGRCAEGLQPNPSGTPPACVPLSSAPPVEPPPPSPLWGHPCYLAPLDGSESLRMGLIDSTGEYCVWDGLRLPLGAVISPPHRVTPEETQRQHPTALAAPPNEQSSLPPMEAQSARGVTSHRAKTPPATRATPPPSAPLHKAAKPQPASHVERVTEEPPSFPGSPFGSGFVDRAKAGYKHARDIYRAVKQHGVGVVLPSDQDAEAWLRRVKEECVEHLDDCLREKAQEAADELNTFRKKPRDEQMYTAGGWAFDALVSTAATVVSPGGGVVAGTAMKEGEQAAAKGAMKAAAKKAGKEIGEEAVEGVEDAAGRKVAKETEERLAREAVEHPVRRSPDGVGGQYVPRTPEGQPMPLPRSVQGEPVPSSPHPHTQIGWRDGRKGGYRQAREFGEDGKLVKDTDWTDHGRPAQHTNPHDHPWQDNPTGGTPRRGGP